MDNTEALRKEFEGEFPVPDRIFFNQISGKYIGNYAYCKSLDELACIYNLQFESWKAAHDSQQKVIDSLRAENERLSDELLNLSKWKEINGFRGDSWQGQLSEALNDVARELCNVAKGQPNE